MSPTSRTPAKHNTHLRTQEQVDLGTFLVINQDSRTLPVISFVRTHGILTIKVQAP
jgi:hypothetical protein